MLHLLHIIILFFITLPSSILSSFKVSRSRNGKFIASKNEDIFGILGPPTPPPSKIDLYVNDWIRNFLESNGTGFHSVAKNVSSLYPVSKDSYYLGTNLLVNTYCFPLKSEKACMQVLLKPREYEEIPVKFRVFRITTNSKLKNLRIDDKKIFKAFEAVGEHARKHKKKHHKHNKHNKVPDAVEEFYDNLRKKTNPFNSQNNIKDNYSIKLPNHRSLDASFPEHMSEYLKRKVPHETKAISETDKKAKNTTWEINGRISALRPWEDRSVQESLKKENDEEMNNNNDYVWKPNRKEREDNENAIKLRSKRHKPLRYKHDESDIDNASSSEIEFSDDTDEENRKMQNDEYSQHESSISEDSSHSEDSSDSEDSSHPKDSIQLKDISQPKDIIRPKDSSHPKDSSYSSEDSSQTDDKEHGHKPDDFFRAGTSLEEKSESYSSEQRPVLPYRREDIFRSGFQGMQQVSHPGDWNRCQLPSPRKTAEVLCKVLPSKMVCMLYCVHGYTYPEGIIRETVCQPQIGQWSRSFDECQPYVDCTLRLKTAGYLKCTTNTIRKFPKCDVECQRYSTYPATPRAVHQCDMNGIWHPPVPHCVESEGINVVPPPRKKL